MGGLREKLTSIGVVGLDTSIFIYHLEGNPTYAPLTKIVFENMESGKFQGITSTITLMELTVLPWRMGHENVAREYEALLVNFPNLSILDIDRNVARLAAKLRVDFNVSPADALQVAASLQAGAKAFLTNDKRLTSLQAVIDDLILDDFVEMEK
jgi:predicted nucleic acid-binding protein